MPESVVSPFDLHEGFPWANTAILASVPPRAGQYRFVRIIPVLIFPGARSCVGFVLPKARPAQSPGTNPQRIPVTESPRAAPVVVRPLNMGRCRSGRRPSRWS